MNILLIGNCQCDPIRTAFRMLFPYSTTDRVMLHLEKDRRKEVIEERLRRYDMVVSQPANSGYEGFSTDFVRSVVGDARLMTFSNIHFEGLHPDVTYFGPSGRRLMGSLGEYHSAIILAAYLGGYSEAACRTFFEGELFGEFGYIQRFDESLAELAARSDQVDVPFFDEFEVSIRSHPSMMTFNHPTSDLLIAYARKLSREVSSRTGAVRSDFPLSPYNCPSFLSENIIWPIYPALAAAHLQGRGGSLWFRRNLNVGGSPMIHLNELISSEYTKYRDVALQDFEAAPQFSAVSKIRDVMRLHKAQF